MRKRCTPFRLGDRTSVLPFEQLALLVCICVVAIGCPGGGGSGGGSGAGSGAGSVGGHLVTVNSSAVPLPVGESETFTATSSHPSDTFIWLSSDESIATVSSNGTVLAIAQGSAVILAEGSASGISGAANLTVITPGTSMLLWDGESGWSGANGSLNTTRPFKGSACFEGVPDPYLSPSINLYGYESYREGLADFDEIWLVGAVSQAGRSFNFSTYSWPNTSNSVDVSNYVAGGALSTEWKVVQIPITDLVTQDYGLETIEQLNFGEADPDGHSIFVDEVWAVDSDAFSGSDTPLMGPVQDVDFGDVVVQNTAYLDITLTNIGNGTLSVNQVSKTGQHPDEFIVPLSPFTIEPGATHTLNVTFAPDSLQEGFNGVKSTSLVLAHDATPMGAFTEVLLTGRTMTPAISVSHSVLDFGGVPEGLSVSRILTATNIGTLPLQVSSISTSNPAFQASPSSFSLTPGSSQPVSVVFSSSSVTSFAETLTILSDALQAESLEVGLSATGLAAGSTGSLPVEVSSVTSSTVEVYWPSIAGASTARIYLGPEPATTVDTALPTQVLLDTLTSGYLTSYEAQDLAPSVDMFFHVEILDGTATIIAQGNTHARTVGGPRANLDGVVKNVHMVDPKILCVVLTNEHVHSFSETIDFFDLGIEEVIGETGAEFQAGAWTVTRATGNNINVANVYRKSSPVGNYYYEVGFGTQTWDNFVDVDHEIYLELSEPVGGPDVLSVTGPTVNYEFMTQEFDRENRQATVQFLLPFSDHYLETPVMQVNQVGYSPRATERWAYVSGWLGDGGPLSLDGFPGTASVLVEPNDSMMARQAVVSGLPITLRAAFDEDSGTEVREIDLSSLPASEGSVYRVHIPGVGVSWPTQVSETAVFKSFYAIARGLFHNRWGGDLRPDLTEWSRPPDHLTVYTAEESNPGLPFPLNTPLVGEFFLPGGHHDAGDFDIRLFHGLVGEILLNAFDANTDAFADGQLTLPESGNGIPDLLDEALWNIAAWEHLQDANGGVRMGVESYRHPWGHYFAHEDPLTYWTYSVNPVHTARVAGIFAQASRLVEPYDAVKAGELLVRAVSAYDYALGAGVNESAGGPIMYAAGELFRVTGEASYKTMVLNTWEAHRTQFDDMPTLYDRDIPWASSYIDDVQPIVPDHIVGYLGSADVITEHASTYADRLVAKIADSNTTTTTTHAHRNGRPENMVPDWGKGTVLGQYLRGIYPSLQLLELNAQDKQKVLNSISLNADYVLGCNPLGRTWITGLGSRPPQDPLHSDSLAFMAQGMPPIPGIPVYGPSASISTFTYYAYGSRLAYPSYNQRPNLRRYGDIHTFVTSNEFTVWESQAEQTRLFALLIGSGMAPPASWLPGGTEHRNSLAPRGSAVASP